MLESLPEENYASLRYLITFLAQVGPPSLRPPAPPTVLTFTAASRSVVLGIEQQRGEQDDRQQPSGGVRAQPSVGA